MASIVYTYRDDLYINLTNQCPCNCTFCIRGQTDTVGSADSLWLETDPTPQQVIAALMPYDLSSYGEVVFCGYGEPFCALDAMLEVCRYIRSIGDVKIRVNTNGLGDLIQNKPTAHLLEGNLDIVSVSLNAPDAQTYSDLCRPVFGADAYAAMLRFVQDCKKYVPEVKVSVVDVISLPDIEACQKIARDLDVALRVRHFA